MFKKAIFQKSLLNAVYDSIILNKLFYDYTVTEDRDYIFIDAPLHVVITRSHKLTHNLTLSVELPDGRIYGILGDFFENRSNMFHSVFSAIIVAKDILIKQIGYVDDKHIFEVYMLKIQRQYEREFQGVMDLLNFEYRIKFYNQCAGIRNHLEEFMSQEQILAAKLVQ